MKNLLKYLSIGNILSGWFLMTLGLFLVTGGQIGVQVGERGPVWVPIPRIEQTWVAWVIVWLGFDSMFNNKITNLILTRIVYPILKPILEPISKHPIIQKIVEKLEEKHGTKPE